MVCFDIFTVVQVGKKKFAHKVRVSVGPGQDQNKGFHLPIQGYFYQRMRLCVKTQQTGFIFP